MSFEANSTEAEKALEAEVKRCVPPPSVERIMRVWRDEIAARQAASGFTTKPPENNRESAENAAFAVMLAAMIEEALKARSLGVGNDAIFWRLSERYEAAQRIAPPPRSYSHWGMFDDA